MKMNTSFIGYGYTRKVQFPWGGAGEGEKNETYILCRVMGNDLVVGGTHGMLLYIYYNSKKTEKR